MPEGIAKREASMRAFELCERGIRPGQRQVEVTGELDLATWGVFEAALARAGEDQGHLVADLSECDSSTSEGLPSSCGHAGARGPRSEAVVIGVRGQVKRLLADTRSSKDERMLVQP